MVCQCVVKHALSDTDTPQEAALKRLLIPGGIFCGTVGLIVALNILPDGGRPHPPLTTIGSAVCVSACCIVVAFPLATKTLPVWLVESTLLLYTIGILLVDWVVVAMGLPDRPWPLMVVVVDMLLIARARERVQRGIVALVVTWLSATALESAYRLGLFDIPLLSDDHTFTQSQFDCADPPCATGAGSQFPALCLVTIVFVFDFICTRSFATRMYDQQQMIALSVAVAGEIATLLAAYDVSAAKKALRAHEAELPFDLLLALRKLLANLEEYRPYLPQSLLGSPEVELASTCDSWMLDAVLPPQHEGREVCICFTDIQSSAELWQAAPQGMHEGLNLHNAEVRAVAAEEGGYEVKTIGDAFMLAFSETASACAFSMTVQSRLLAVAWPDDLLQCELCALRRAKEGGQILWNGLRIRIGLHTGEVLAQTNPVTRRVDYFGTTVNTASRVEATVQRGGLTGITQASLHKVDDEALAAIGHPTVQSLGPRTLKGLAEPVVVLVMVPPELAERAQLATEGDTMLTAPLVPVQCEDSSCSSSGTASAASSGFNSNLHLRLRPTRMACTVVRMALPPTDLEDFVTGITSLVECAAMSTDGDLRSVMSSSMMVTWSRGDRALLCYRFLLALGTLRKKDLLHCGAATSLGMIGNVAAHRRRFVTVFGGCVELAASLADEAVLCDDFALAVSDVAMHAREAGTGMRAQMWRVIPTGYLLVWEVCPPADDDKWACLRSAGSWEKEKDMEVEEVLLALSTGDDLDASCLPDTEQGRYLRERLQRGAIRERRVAEPWAFQGRDSSVYSGGSL